MIHTLFLDLHGVLADPKLIHQNYTERIAEILTPTGISFSKAEQIHDQAFDFWLEEFVSMARETRSANEKGYFLVKARELDEKYTEFILQHIPSSYIAMDELRSQLNPKSLEYQAARRKNAFYPEVKDTLKSIKRKFEGRIVCASDAHSRHVRGCLEAGEVISYFDEIIGYDIAQCNKLTPKKCFLHEILKITNSDPNTCFIVDDRIDTLQDAFNIGMNGALMDREKRYIDKVNNWPRLSDLSQLTSRLL